MTRTFVASAPGRCGIIGNPSDIYGGVVVSCSVPARNRCTLQVGATGKMPNDLRLWQAATKRFPLERQVTLRWDSDVPRSSGLSGSTATLAATLLCLLAARGEAPDLSAPTASTDFAELVRDVERHDAGIVCGYQDAYMVVHGGIRRMEFAGKHPVEGGPPASLRKLEVPLPFLLVTTGIERLSGSVHGPMTQRWVAGEVAVVDGMARIAELGRLGVTALEDQAWEDLAVLMNENQTIIASLGGSGEPVDRLIHDCLKSGAVAAKLAGAGLGGTVIALADDVEELRERLTARGYQRFMCPSDEPGVRLEPPAAV